jgi:hypothetical protein
VAALNQPLGLAFTCTGVDRSLTGINIASIPGAVPGEIAATSALAIGVLPGSLGCTVRPVDAAGNPVTAAPGTIEITSLNGTLLSLSGTLTSNLRIGCGDPSQVTVNTALAGGVINANLCQGVAFSVLGQGVGVVELRARYEPVSPTLFEVEGRGTVTFVAPPVGVSLALDPNPVAVGSTGTATATLSTVYTPTCTGTITIGGTVSITSACINPTTGLTITTASNPGSSLNGIVVFATDNSAIARSRRRVRRLPRRPSTWVLPALRSRSLFPAAPLAVAAPSRRSPSPTRSSATSSRSSAAARRRRRRMSAWSRARRTSPRRSFRSCRVRRSLSVR